VLCPETVSALAFQASSATASVSPAASQASPLSMVYASPVTPTAPSAQEMSTLALNASVASQLIHPPIDVSLLLHAIMARPSEEMVSAKESVTKAFSFTRVSVSLEGASMDTMITAMVDALETLKSKPQLLLASTVSSC